MSLKVPKFDFEDLPPAKPAKPANLEIVECDFSNFGNISNCEVADNSFPPKWSGDAGGKLRQVRHKQELEAGGTVPPGKCPCGAPEWDTDVEGKPKCWCCLAIPGLFGSH
jgi:hypothetical protein